MGKLLFVDTNIYLDFYRIRNEVKTPFLSHLEAIKNNLIMTDQVEMEFKKNRQGAILEGMNVLKAPGKISVPSVLRQDNASKAIDRNIENIKARIKKLRERYENVLGTPVRYDKVYQVLQRLFAKKKEIDLYRKSEKRYDIRELAHKRFVLGYPPRKKNDTSMGDAINWEWLVYVSKKKNADIWIVSRDSDFGVTINGKGFLNDWLKQEFSDRVNKKRDIVLCTRLSDALKEFNIPVTIEEEKEESRVINLQARIRSTSRTSEINIYCGDHDEENDEVECGICGVPASRSSMRSTEAWGYICDNHDVY